MTAKISFHSSNILCDELINKCNKIYDICCMEDNTEYPFFIDNETENTQFPLLYYGTTDKKIIGFISAYVIDSHNVEICGFVLPKYRRKGIASSLLDNLLEYYEEYNIHVAIRYDNFIGKAFLNSYDFKYVSTECKMLLTQSDFNISHTKIMSKSTPYEKIKLQLIQENENNSKIYHAYILDNTIGGCMISLFGNSAIIHNVEITESFRRKGYGYLLLAEVITELFNTHDTIILHVTKENIPAYKLYTKLGFHITEELEYYYI